MNEPKKLQFGLATVTPKGLVFEDKVFSNQMMIRCKWFEHSKRDGFWQIPVMYLETMPTKLFLFDLGSMEVATTVEQQQTMTEDEVHEYFQMISNIRDSFKEQEWRKDGGPS